MGKKMYVEGSGTAYVEIEIGAEEVVSYIENYADQADRQKIYEALSSGDVSSVIIDNSTLEGSLRFELAQKIAGKYTLAELIDLEKEIFGGVTA